MMDDITLAVTLGGVFVLLSTFPQVIHSFITRKTRDLDFFLTVFAIVGLGFYVYYAVRTEQWIFAMADASDLTMWSIVTVIKVRNLIKGVDNIKIELANFYNLPLELISTFAPFISLHWKKKELEK